MPFLRVGYKKLFYTDAGPASTVAVRDTFIFSHGLGSSHNFFGAVVPHFVRQGFRCISYDKTGSTRSPYTGVEQSIDSLADDAIGILDALKIDKAVFVGHSMGGIEAANASIRHPDRTVAAVWIDAPEPSDELAAVVKKRLELVEAGGMEAMADTLPLTELSQAAPPIAGPLMREFLLGHDPAGFISSCRALIAARPPVYGDIRVPTLILAGAPDVKDAPVERLRRQYEALGAKPKKLQLMSNVGHWQCLEAPDRIAEYILDFYNTLHSPPTTGTDEKSILV